MEHTVPEAVLMINNDASGDSSADAAVSTGDLETMGMVPRVFFLGLLAAAVTFVIIQGVKVLDEEKKNTGSNHSRLLLEATALATALAVILSLTSYKFWGWFVRWFLIVAAICVVVVFVVILINRLDDDNTTNAPINPADPRNPRNNTVLYTTINPGDTARSTHVMNGSGVSIMIDCENRVKFQSANPTISVSSDGVTFFDGGSGIVVVPDNAGKFVFHGDIHFSHIRIELRNTSTNQIRVNILISDS